VPLDQRFAVCVLCGTTRSKVNAHDAQKQHAQAIASARAIQNDADKNSGGVLTAEQSENYNKAIADAEKYKAEYDRLSKLEGLEVESKASAGRVSKPVELPKGSKQRYSLIKAARELASGKGLTGLEAEISQEIAHQYGKDPQGFYFPTRFEAYDFDLSAGTGSVVSQHKPEEFIDALRNKMITALAGARVLADLTGSSITIPKKTATTTAYWVGESTAPTESAGTIGQVTLTPKTVGAYVDISRKLMLQSSLDVEAMVRQDLIDTLAVELDRVGLNGSGSGSEPTGILQNGSINSVAVGTNGGAPTYAHFVSMETEVADDNADIGTLAYIVTPKLRGKMKVTEKASSTAQFLWEPGNLVNGYNCYVTKQLPDNLTKGTASGVCSAALFGNFADLIYGMWGALDLTIDPYSNSTTGILRLVALQDAAVAVRRNESFCAVKDFTTT